MGRLRTLFDFIVVMPWTLKRRAKENRQRAKEEAQQLAEEFNIWVERCLGGGLAVHPPHHLRFDPYAENRRVADWGEVLVRVKAYAALITAEPFSPRRTPTPRAGRT